MAIKNEFKIQRQGKTYVLYAGLLQEAHSQFKESFRMETDLVEQEPVTVVIARFYGTRTDEGGHVETTGIGTAGRKTDTKGPAVDAPIEMAETRAKARALRDATNIGITAFEELSEEDEDQPQRSEKAPRKLSKGPSSSRGGQTQEQASEPQAADSEDEDQGEPALITERQEEEIIKLCGELKKKGQTKEQAVEAYEESLGFPIGLLTEEQAGKRIAQLNNFKRERRERRSS